MSFLSRFKVGQETQIDGKSVHAMFVIGSVYYDVRAMGINRRVHLCTLSFNHECQRTEQGGERLDEAGGGDFGHDQILFGPGR